MRLDLSHSAWSDIFFLGMDYPEGARVLNISVDLGVHGRDLRPGPPIECRVRVIAEPLLRLTSIDLNACKDVESLEELFNFGNDYLGLVKAGVIASGLVPPSLEGTTIKLEDLLARVVRPGHGLEIVSKVNDIPKGSRLAVSTNLLASLIAVLMRATGQTRNLTGPLDLDEARVVVARAILGEWLGGSGGGWQDSGGVFPGIKLIHGVAAADTDPEWGVSRGRLLPAHRLLDGRTARPAAGGRAAGPAPFEDALAASLVLVHGGMAQNVGPILNMVTTKYLLRSHGEWLARQEALRIFDRVLAAVDAADVRALGHWTTEKWLMLHNIDTLGGTLDATILGLACQHAATLSFEVIPRRIDDRGGGLARVAGRLRILEGLAQPREETEFAFRYYNTLTSWVRIDGLLQTLHLTRDDLTQAPEKVAAAVRTLAARVPTYVTIKDVKRRWGHGQEDVFPVAQFEKLWGDLTSLPDLPCAFLAVPRLRGQQLKDAAQLDGWVTDGSRDHVESLCAFPR